MEDPNTVFYFSFRKFYTHYNEKLTTMKGTIMNLTFKDKDIVITGKDANVLAGFAIIGIAAFTVVAYKVGYEVGHYGYQCIMKLQEKRKAKLNK